MTPAEIVARLRAVAADMESLGAAMDYFGGFNGRMTRFRGKPRPSQLAAQQLGGEAA